MQSLQFINDEQSSYIAKSSLSICERESSSKKTNQQLPIQKTKTLKKNINSKAVKKVNVFDNNKMLNLILGTFI